MNVDTKTSCTVCNKHEASVCGRCKSAHYCSTACQRNDWPTHRLLCSSFSSFDTLSRPNDKYIRAIHFPVEDRKPKVVWLQLKWHGDMDDFDRFQLPNIDSILGSDSPQKRVPILSNLMLKRDLSDTIFVCYRDTFLIDGSKSNKSIASITATKPGQYHDWRGPVVAYGMCGSGINPGIHKDIDMTDFRHLTDYFLSYNSASLPLPKAQQNSGTNVSAVKINCLGDQMIFGKPHFEAIELGAEDSIFLLGDSSDIAERIGLPIHSRRCHPDPRWETSQGKKLLMGNNPSDNQDATFLHMCCDPNAAFDFQTGQLGFGLAFMQWQSNVGSTIVVRQDKKPLLPLHVEALCRYCRDAILPLFDCCNEGSMSKDAVLARISRPNFAKFWEKLDKKASECKDVNVPSPYKA